MYKSYDISQSALTYNTDHCLERDQLDLVIFLHANAESEDYMVNTYRRTGFYNTNWQQLNLY